MKTRQELNSMTIRQAVSIIPQARIAARRIISQAPPEMDSKITPEKPAQKEEPSFILEQLKKSATFQQLKTAAQDKVKTFMLSSGPKEKIQNILEKTLVPQATTFLDQNKKKLPLYLSNPEQFVEDMMKTISKEELMKITLDAVKGDSNLLASIASIARSVFESAVKSSKASITNSGMQKKAFIPVVIAGLEILLSWGLRVFMVRVVYDILSFVFVDILWPIVKATLVVIAGYLIYDKFTEHFGNWGDAKAAKDTLPKAWKAGVSMATFNALSSLADEKSFDELQTIIKKQGTTQYKIPSTVQKELEVTRDKDQFKKVLEKHKSELQGNIEAMVSSNPAFAGLDGDGILEKIFSLFGGHSSIFGMIFAMLGSLLLGKMMF